MRRHLVLGILALVSGIAAAADAPEPDRQPDTVLPHAVALPDPLREYLEKKLPDFRPVTLEDYGAGRFEGEREDDREGLQWIVKADFDGNGSDDYALLMVGDVKGKRHITLVAARAVKGGWSHELLKSYASDRAVSDTLVVEPAGDVFMGFKKDGMEKVVSLPYPSVAIGGLQQCLSDRYYWKRGKWRSAYIRL